MTAILKAPKVDLDLKAARDAAAREATKARFTFSFGTETVFSVPPLDEWPMEVEVCLADGALSKALAVLLGDQMDAFMACKPTFGDIRRLLEQVGTWAGVESLGNSAPQLPQDSTRI